MPERTNLSPHEAVVRYAEEHALAGLTWVLVPAGDGNFPSVERLMGFGLPALTFLAEVLPGKARQQKIAQAIRRLRAAGGEGHAS